MSKIDFSGITSFIPQAVNQLRDLVKSEIFASKDLQRKITVVDGIKYRKHVGFLDKINDIGKKAHATPCKINEVNVDITTKEKTWKPEPFDTRIILCADTVVETLGVKGVKAGVKRSDLKDTEYLNVFLTFLNKALVEMYNRMAWISDLNAAKIASGGNFTNGLDLDFVNMQDGFFKKADALTAIYPKQHVSLAFANDALTYQAQKDAMTKTKALEVARKLATDMPLDFKYEGVVFGCTREFYRKLIQNFQGFELESMKKNLEQGLAVVNVEGYNFMWIPEWDFMIDKYHNDTTAGRWINPHRVLAIRKDNLLLGVPSFDVWGDFYMFYDERGREFIIDIKDEFDVMFLQDTQFAYAV